MRILCDMDGVLANCMSYWVGLLNRYHGLMLTPEQITDWDVHNFCPLPPGVVYGYLKEPGFFRHLEPIHGAISGLRVLMDQGHHVVIVTACRHGHIDKRAWLHNHLPEFNQANLVFTERKELVSGDVLIDDGIHNLEVWRRNHPKGTAICFAQPYNKDYQGLRVGYWPDVLDLIAGIERMAMAGESGESHVA